MMSPQTQLSVLVVALVFVAVANAQIPFIGSCPDVKPMENFEVSDYMGKWYEAERYFTIFQLAGKCVTADYSINSEGNVNVFNRQISSLTGEETTIEGTARVANASEPAKLIVTFPSVPGAVDAPYWVLKTDYDQYAVVWACSSYGIFNTRFAWILTRDRVPSPEVMQKAYSVLEKNGISRKYFTRTDQKSCQQLDRFDCGAC